LSERDLCNPPWKIGVPSPFEPSATETRTEAGLIFLKTPRNPIHSLICVDMFSLKAQYMWRLSSAATDGFLDFGRAHHLPPRPEPHSRPGAAISVSSVREFARVHETAEDIPCSARCLNAGRIDWGKALFD
jgi:hypothetical protein